MSNDTTLGQVLKLPSYHHAYQLPVPNSLTNWSDKDLVYYLFFELEQTCYQVDLTQSKGYTSQLSQASAFEKEHILDGVVAIPLTGLARAQVIGLPKGQPLSLQALYQHYPKLDILQDLYDRNREQLEPSDSYDPYRKARFSDKSDQAGTAYQPTALSDKDYDKERRPFYRKRNGDIDKVSMTYLDRTTGQTVKLDLHSWFFFENKPPLIIIWKPRHKRQARWRDSHIFVDISSQDLFFQGELYKGQQAPVFLKDLTFTSAVSDTTLANWNTFLKTAKSLKKRKVLIEK